MSLGKFLMTSPVGELVNWDDLKESIATGDILLCQTVGLFGAIEQLATSAPYTHVAMFIRGKNGDLMILESSRTDKDSGYKDMLTGKTDGPKVMDAEFYIHNYIENDMGVLTYRPLRMMYSNEPIEITDEREKRLNDLFDVILKKDIRYEQNPLDLANSLFHVYGMDHTDPTSMFCSETVSTVLEMLDVPLVNVPDKTIPRDFSQKDENIIDKDKNEEKGSDAVELGNEVTIVLVKDDETNDSNAGAKITADFPFSKIPIGPRVGTRSLLGRDRGGPLSSDRRTTNEERFLKLAEILRRTSYRLPPWKEEERKLASTYEYVSPYEKRSKDIKEFETILYTNSSRPWVDEEFGPVDVNQIIITYKNEETGEIRRTDTLLSLAVMNDLEFKDMIQKYENASYVDILLSYKTFRERMLYSDKYRPYVRKAEDIPDGIIELEKKFGILDINQRIIRHSAAGTETFESDALIEAIEFGYEQVILSLLYHPSVDDTLAYKYVEDKIVYDPSHEYWKDYKHILNTERVRRGMGRLRHALDHDNESLIRKLLKIDSIAVQIDVMNGTDFRKFISNSRTGQGPQPKIEAILYAWKRRKKEGGKEYYDEYWGSYNS